MPAPKKDRILLHACCAICSGYPIEYLEAAGYAVSVYFYNPNIYPESEWIKRVEAQRQLFSEVIVEDYSPKDFYNISKGLELAPEGGERCLKCFELRLDKTAQKAKAEGFDAFTTSIVISPHKNFEKITEIGKKLGEKYGIKYLPINFKKQDGFLKTNQIARELNLYRQNYCGCEYSIRR